LLLWLLWPVFPTVFLADRAVESASSASCQTFVVGVYWWVLLMPLAVLEVVWVHHFLTRTRPRLQEVWSRRLGVAIGYGPSMAWQAPRGSGAVKGLQVAVVDIGLLIGATLGPIAVVLLLVFLVAG
jgi:hypothetical protein